MRLYYHPESDALFWDEFCADPYAEDVTDQAKFQDAAAARGVICPGKISPVIDALESEVGNDVIVNTIGGMAGAIQKSYKNWDRKPSDFYPTPYDGTESLIPAIEQIRLEIAGPVRPFKVWEPCSGDLDMTRVLEWHGYEVTSTELRDTGQGITGFDFLNDDPTEKWGWIPDPDMIVMNPPFSLAAEFIEKALSYSPNVACLVKIDYWNAISRLPLWRRRVPAFFFPLTFRLAFLKEERGNSPLMNCAWVVWTDVAIPNLCAMEPLPKRVYPGYQGNGVRKSFAKLGQAVDELTEALCVRSKS
jgi:hypothetical protein